MYLGMASEKKRAANSQRDVYVITDVIPPFFEGADSSPSPNDQTPASGAL
jgi:hypothetical protein